MGNCLLGTGAGCTGHHLGRRLHRRRIYLQYLISPVKCVPPQDQFLTGDTLWTRTFGGSQYNLQGRSVQQTSDGGYIIAGPAQGSEWGIFLVKTQAEGLVLSVQNDPSVVPMAFGLEQNYPNPFNPSTTIRYALPHRSHVTLTVFSILGQQITTLVNGDIDAGYHTVQFDGSELASGVDLYRMQAGNFVQTRKLLLVR